MTTTWLGAAMRRNNWSGQLNGRPNKLSERLNKLSSTGRTSEPASANRQSGQKRLPRVHTKLLNGLGGTNLGTHGGINHGIRHGPSGIQAPCGPEVIPHSMLGATYLPGNRLFIKFLLTFTAFVGDMCVLLFIPHLGRIPPPTDIYDTKFWMERCQ